MPKGTSGCWKCGHDTTLVVQLWLRDYTEVRTALGTRKQASIDSVSRYLCSECGHPLAARIAAALERTTVSYHGCGRCGAPTASRIQCWLRDRNGRTIFSKATSFCEECADQVHEITCSELGGEQLNMTGQRGGDLSQARRRLAEKCVSAAEAAA
jgi:hypothetical protein